MKPRLESLPLTTEDLRIWHGIMWRPALLIGRGVDRVPYLKADIRDADLMLKAQYKRTYVAAHTDRRLPIRVGNIDCGWRLGRDWLDAKLPTRRVT